MARAPSKNAKKTKSPSTLERFGFTPLKSKHSIISSAVKKTNSTVKTAASSVEISLLEDYGVTQPSKSKVAGVEVLDLISSSSSESVQIVVMSPSVKRPHSKVQRLNISKSDKSPTKSPFHIRELVLYNAANHANFPIPKTIRNPTDKNLGRIKLGMAKVKVKCEITGNMIPNKNHIGVPRKALEILQVYPKKLKLLCLKSKTEGHGTKVVVQRENGDRETFEQSKEFFLCLGDSLIFDHFSKTTPVLTYELRRIPLVGENIEFEGCKNATITRVIRYEHDTQHFGTIVIEVQKPNTKEISRNIIWPLKREHLAPSPAKKQRATPNYKATPSQESAAVDTSSKISANNSNESARKNLLDPMNETAAADNSSVVKSLETTSSKVSSVIVNKPSSSDDSVKRKRKEEKNTNNYSDKKKKKVCASNTEMVEGFEMKSSQSEDVSRSKPKPCQLKSKSNDEASSETKDTIEVSKRLSGAAKKSTKSFIEKAASNEEMNIVSGESEPKSPRPNTSQSKTNNSEEDKKSTSDAIEQNNKRPSREAKKNTPYYVDEPGSNNDIDTSENKNTKGSRPSRAAKVKASSALTLCGNSDNNDEDRIDPKDADITDSPKIGEVGFEFEKLFDDGWFKGVIKKVKVPHPKIHAEKEIWYYCVYEDGDQEDMNMKGLRQCVAAMKKHGRVLGVKKPTTSKRGVGSTSKKSSVKKPNSSMKTDAKPPRKKNLPNRKIPKKTIDANLKEIEQTIELSVPYPEKSLCKLKYIRNMPQQMANIVKTLIVRNEPETGIDHLVTLPGKPTQQFVDYFVELILFGLKDGNESFEDAEKMCLITNHFLFYTDMISFDWDIFERILEVPQKTDSTVVVNRYYYMFQFIANVLEEKSEKVEFCREHPKGYRGAVLNCLRYMEMYYEMFRHDIFDGSNDALSSFALKMIQQYCRILYYVTRVALCKREITIRELCYEMNDIICRAHPSDEAARYTMASICFEYGDFDDIVHALF